MRYKILVEYDGSKYVGWQKQPDQPDKSIEEILMNAIRDLTKQEVKINCAGRTDSGVHAIAQCADFAIDKHFDEEVIVRGLNRFLLGYDVAVTNCEIVDESFHSRYDAKARIYEYRIINRSPKLALDQGRAWHVPLKLNVAAMHESGQFLIGLHDFSSFRDSNCQANTALRRVDKIEVVRQGDLVTIKVEAKSYLHHMVRNIAGTLVLVGLGKMAVEEMAQILAAKDRTKSGRNAPACGLYFVEAVY